MQNKSSFTLPTTNKFSVQTGTASKPSKKGELSTHSLNDGSSLTSSIVQTGALVGIINASKDITKDVLEHYNSNTGDSDLSALLADFQTEWGLN